MSRTTAADYYLLLVIRRESRTCGGGPSLFRLACVYNLRVCTRGWRWASSAHRFSRGGEASHLPPWRHNGRRVRWGRRRRTRPGFITREITDCYHLRGSLHDWVRGGEARRGGWAERKGDEVGESLQHRSYSV